MPSITIDKSLSSLFSRLDNKHHIQKYMEACTAAAYNNNNDKNKICGGNVINKEETDDNERINKDKLTIINNLKVIAHPMNANMNRCDSTGKLMHNFPVNYTLGNVQFSSSSPPSSASSVCGHVSVKVSIPPTQNNHYYVHFGCIV
jgi:hypothetical protein